MQHQLNEMESQNQQLARRQRKMEYKLNQYFAYTGFQIVSPPPTPTDDQGSILFLFLFCFHLHWGQCIFLSMGEWIYILLLGYIISIFLVYVQYMFGLFMFVFQYILGSCVHFAIFAFIIYFILFLYFNKQLSYKSFWFLIEIMFSKLIITFYA